MPLEEDEKNGIEDLVVKIKVINYEEGYVYYWNVDKFEERLEMMRAALDNFFHYNLVIGESDSDPFWDPKELIMNARGICLVKNVVFRFTMH